jgi:uncharacterized protein (DUF488 family)
MKIYTLGYEKRNISEFINELQKFNISILIDVREFAWSCKKGFSKTQFAKELANFNIDYIHIPEAGNPKSIRKGSNSINTSLKRYNQYLNRTGAGIDELFDIIILASTFNLNLCLTCYEREHENCHRSVIAQYLNQLNNSIIIDHL